METEGVLAVADLLVNTGRWHGTEAKAVSAATSDRVNRRGAPAALWALQADRSPSRSGLDHLSNWIASGRNRPALLVAIRCREVGAVAPRPLHHFGTAANAPTDAIAELRQHGVRIGLYDCADDGTAVETV